MAEIYNRPVAEMANHLEGVVQITDHTGKTYTFRKYHWMGNVGLTDKDGQNVLLPALRLRKEIKIFHDYEAIIAGSDRSGWEIYSLDLQRLWPNETFPSKRIVYKKLKDRQKTWEAKDLPVTEKE